MSLRVICGNEFNCVDGHVSAQVETEATHDKVSFKIPDSTVVALPQLPQYSVVYRVSGCPRRGHLYGLRVYERRIAGRTC